jgi:hypothetical protein
MRTALLLSSLFFAIACSSSSETTITDPEPPGPPDPPPPTPPDTTGGEEPRPGPVSTPVPLREGESMATIAEPASLEWTPTPGTTVTLAWITRAQNNVRRLALVAARGTERMDVLELPGEIEGQPCHRTFATLTLTQNGAAVIAAEGLDRIPSPGDAAECPPVRANHLVVFRDDAANISENYTGAPDDAGHGPSWLYPSGRPAATTPRLVARFVMEPQPEDATGTPHTHVTLVTEQLPAATSDTREIGVFNGSCSVLDAAEERGASLQVRCWWAGAGDELILVRTGNRLVVRRAETDEQAPRSRFREIPAARIDLPRDMDVEYLVVQ